MLICTKWSANCHVLWLCEKASAGVVLKFIDCPLSKVQDSTGCCILTGTGRIPDRVGTMFAEYPCPLTLAQKMDSCASEGSSSDTPSPSLSQNPNQMSRALSQTVWSGLRNSGDQDRESQRARLRPDHMSAVK